MEYLWIIVMFLTAVWTLILTAPILCRGSTGEQCNATFLQNCYDEEKLIYILDGLMVSKYLANNHFRENYSFNLD